MNKLPNTQGRVAKWDNVKAILILIVVFGHALSPFLSSPAVKWAELWLYTFHMPLFVFVGGLFAKRTINTVPFQYNKVVGYLLLCFFMKVITYLASLLTGGNPGFSLLSENGVAWYIFATAVHLMIAHLLRNCQPWKIFLASILIAVCAGYIDEIGNTLVLSRIIVFFPIFYLGYALDRDKVLIFVNKPAVRVCSLIFLIVFTVGLYFIIEDVYPLRAVLTGNNPYYEYDADTSLLGAGLRLFCYGLSFVVSLAVLAVTPNKRIPVLTYCGTKTLQIYALHRPIQFIMANLFLTSALKDMAPRFQLPIIMGISIVLTLVLSLKPFEYIIYPCTNWQKFFAPILNWFKKKEPADSKA